MKTMKMIPPLLRRADSLLIALLAMAVCLPALRVAAAPPAGYYLVWADEFNTATMDTNKWDYRFLELWNNATNAISFNGSNLVITAYTTYTTNGAVISTNDNVGMIGTQGKFQFRNGYTEASIKLNNSPGIDMAYWMQSPTMGRYIGDPFTSGVEFDVLEHWTSLGGQGSANIHWDGYGAYHQQTGGKFYGSGLTNGYHAYGWQWTPSQYVVWIDGVSQWTTNIALSGRSEYVILSSGIATWSAPRPAGGYGDLATSTTKMFYDYVRYYAPTNMVFWDGSASAFWSDTNNWVAGKGPANDIVFSYLSASNLATTLDQNLAVNSLTFLETGGAVTISSNTLTLGGGGIDMISATNDPTIHSGVVIGAAQSWNIIANQTLTISGPLSGAANLTVNGAGTTLGTLCLSASNSLTGNTTLGQGVLNLAHSHALQGSTLILSNSAVVGFSNAVASHAFTLGGLGGSGNIALLDTAGSPVVLGLGNNNANTTYAGVLSAAGGLTKLGSGTLTLNGANNYTGNTTVNAGRLALGATGSLNISSSVAIAAGGTFDVSAKASYTWGDSANLTASGNSSGIAATNIVGSTGVNLIGRPVTLNFAPTSFTGDATHPALVVSGAGTLDLTGCTITVNNNGASNLGVGDYMLISGGKLKTNSLPTLDTSTGVGAHTGVVAGGFVSLVFAGSNLVVRVASVAPATTTIALHSGFVSSSTYGDALQFDVTVTGSSPTGTVTVRDGGASGTILGTATLSGGAATVTLTNLTALQVGSHANIVAVYSGDANNGGSSSSALTPAQSVSAKTLTVTGATVQSRYYDGTTNAILNGGALAGVLSGDTVTLNGTGYFANAGPGTGIAVTSTSTLGGASAGNYTLTQPTGLSGTIFSSATPGVWTGAAGTGFWETSGNWSSNAVPNGANVTADFSTLDIAADQTVNLTNAETIGNLIFGDTNTTTAAGWTLANNGNGANTLTLAGTTPTITVNALGGTKSVTISNVVAGTSGLIKSGAGTLTLSGNNTYAGDTTLLGTGALNLANPTAAGTGTLSLKSAQTTTATTLGLSGGITVANAIQMDSTTGREWIKSTGMGNNALTGGITVTGAGGNSLVIDNSQTSGTLTVSSGLSGATYAGGLSLRGSLAGDVGIFNGAINAPAGGMENAGAANWTLNTAGSVVKANAQFSGGITIQSSGGFNLGAANALPAAPLSFAAGATGKVNLNGYDQTLAGVQTYTPITTGNGGIITNGSATSDATLTLAALPGNFTFYGVIQDGSARKVSLVMNSAGKTQTLSGTNTYSGNTTISAGTLVLSGGALLTNTASIVVASNAIFNVSGLSSAFTLAQSRSSQTLSNSAPGAIINGTNNCSAGTVSLVYNGVNPSFTITNGGMTLSTATSLKVNNTGARLAAGTSYKLIAKATAGTGGLVAGAVTASPVTVSGYGAAATATLAITNGELWLNVAAPVTPTTPTNLTATASSGVLALSWPSNYLGWYLQAQTNALNTGLSTNWVTLPGSQLVTSTNLPISPANGSVFYRMVYANNP